MANWSGSQKLTRKVLKRYADKVIDTAMPVVDAEFTDYFWFPTVAFGKLMKMGGVNPVKVLSHPGNCRAFGGPCSGYEWSFWHYQIRRLRSHHELQIRTYDQYNFRLMPAGTGASRVHLIVRRHTSSEDIEAQKRDPTYKSMELVNVDPEDQHMLSDLTKIDFKAFHPMGDDYYLSNFQATYL